MKCPHCNAVIADTAKFCPLCGGRIAAVPGQTAVPQQPVQPQQAAGQYEIYQGYQAVPTDKGQMPPGYVVPSQPVYGQQPPVQTVAEQPKLKWYKFVIYFQLFANALLNFTTGLSYITGSVYVTSGVTAENVYAYYGSALKVCDVAMGIVCIAMAVFALYVRQRLAKFRSGAPKLYLALLGAGIAAVLVYTLVTMGITDVNTLAETLSSLVGNVVLLVLNIVYFNKRGHLFVN